MIKILSADASEPPKVVLEFSDGTSGVFDLSELIERDTVMVQPLREPDYFRRCFVELGALCWPNRFELSAGSLHRKLEARGAKAEALSAQWAK